MYQDNTFPPICESAPVQGSESPHMQLYRAWDGSYFAVPTLSTISNKDQMDANSTVTSSVSDAKTMSAIHKKKRKPLQNITNLTPPVPNSQLVLPPPNTQIPGLFVPNMFQGTPQLYHPEASTLIQMTNPALGLLNPYHSVQSTPTSNSHLAAVTANRFHEPSPNIFHEPSPNRFHEPSPNSFHEPSSGFDIQQPFDVLLNNLQEFLSSDHHVKNASKATETASIQPNLAHAYTPSEDVWQRYPPSMQLDTSFNKRILPNMCYTSDVSYTTNQVVPNVSSTPYSLGFSVSATQYPGNWITPNIPITETSYPYNQDVTVTEPRLLTNQIVPNISAKELSPKTSQQTVPNILPEESSQQILPNSSPRSVDISQSMDQEKVAAREHSLKVRFNLLARNQAMSPQVKELSSFFKSQSAQVEMYRLQQLTEASYPHYKEQVNHQCDSQLHQLMDRVEVSLQILEKCGKENHEVGRRKIPDAVSKVLDAWYCTNALHPYPTAEIYIELACTTGMKVQQVRKWFSNKRCRTKALNRSMGKICIKQ